MQPGVEDLAASELAWRVRELEESLASKDAEIARLNTSKDTEIANTPDHALHGALDGARPPIIRILT